ncbi:MAG: MBL fold metallo-hydrolase [Bacteroidetes bacterium]|nr:MBL fold metallo-hydrolase [Bacteroidota bacterium]
MLSRRTFLRRTSAALLAAPFLPSAFPFHRTDDAFRSLRRNVGIFQQRGGTIGWLANDDALVVIDTQFPESAQQCWTGLHDRTGRDIDLLINTHHHGDHTGGNATMQPHAARHVAQQNVPTLQRQAAERSDDGPPQAYADDLFDTEWSDDLGDETVRLRHYGPAHTGGDAVIHFERADVVHMGDLVFNRMPCFIDLPGGASTAGWIETLEQVHAAYTDETIFIHGHGNPEFGVTGSRADLLVMRDFLTGLNEYVAEGRKAGTPIDELAAVERLPGFPDHHLAAWADGIPNAIRAVYREQTSAE